MSDFVDFVKSMAEDAKEDRFAISVISSFLSSVGTGSAGDLDALLRVWQADMILSGIKTSTRKRYFSRLHTIYSQWPGAGTDDPFNISVNISVNTPADGAADDYAAAMAMADANLDIAKRLALKSVDSRPNEYLSVFFYLLYDIDASLTDAINLRFDDPTPRLSQVDDLVDAMRGSKHRKYVFNLNRGAKRLTQVSRELIAGMDTELTKQGMKFGGAFSRESITAIWIAAALRCRITLGDIRALVRTLPTEYSFLSLIDPTPLTDTRKASILKVVADSINDKTRQWFVMRMRSGRTPDDIRQAMEYKVPDLYGDMSFFYPTHVRYREGKGKKMVKEEVPYIPGILFFKTRRDLVGKLFSKIGDMAWCYKYTNTPGSPYSTISRREMEKFQRHIGKFSDDIKMELVTDTGTRFAVDDVVKINGGMMAGSVGVITAVHNQDGTTTYTLQLSSDSACVWTVKDMEEIYIEKV